MPSRHSKGFDKILTVTVVGSHDLRGACGVEGLNIYTLLTIIRGFSNDITVRALAADLGISYSTLARCKNGVWPRSITLDAMRTVLDDCRKRFFDGDGNALARSVMLQLGSQELDVRPLETALQHGGYDVFVAKLLAYASNPPRKTEAAESAPDTRLPDPRCKEATAPFNALTSTAPSVPSESSHAREAALTLLIGTVLLLGLLRFSLAKAFVWASSQLTVLFACSLLIALSPVLAGILIDAPLAWRTYRLTHPDEPLTTRSFVRVAKYGGANELVAGAGRYNLTTPYVAYKAICNVAGMLCPIALLVYLLSLPDFASFFVSHEWVEYLKAGIVAAFLVAYGDSLDQMKRPVLTGIPDDAITENPDNYLPSRVHVWANGIHLVWTISLAIMLLLAMLAHGAASPKAHDCPPLILWPYLQAVAFLSFASVSGLASRIRATCIGIFLPGIMVLSIGFTTYALACFRPSLGSATLCLSCIVCMSAAALWTRKHAHDNQGDWLVSGNGSSRFVGVIVGSLAILLIMGLATAALA